jgi:nitrogen fixation NifU-like protein
MEIEELYREVILDHYQNPRNYGELNHSSSCSKGVYPFCNAEGENPLCGDSISIQFLIKGDILADIRFRGTGCAISLASASIMTELVKGKTLEEIDSLISRVKSIMEGEKDSTDELGDFQSLEGVRNLPLRVKCVLLAWTVLEEGIKDYRMEVKDV